MINKTESTILRKCDVRRCGSMRDLIRINHGEEVPKFLCHPHFEQYRPKSEWHDLKRKEVADRSNKRLEQTRQIIEEHNPLYGNI